MPTIQPLEILFKKVDGLDIYLDAYIPPNATPEAPAPIVLWWHGGGLLQGTRKGISPHQLSSPVDHGLCFVSADHRLAPQTRLPAILSDVSSAISFVASKQFAEATGNKVDTSKIVLSGSSAGGFLALLGGTGIGFAECGLERPSKVNGIAGIYPITDLEDPFWTTKQRPVSYMKRVIDAKEVEPFINPDDTKVVSSALDAPRSIFYHYMVQEALLPSLLLDGTGISPSAFSVAAGIDSGKYDIPPVYLTHGTIDDKVPVCQATDVVEALKRRGLSVVYDEFEGLDHLFDRNDPECKLEGMYKFIKEVCI